MKVMIKKFKMITSEFFAPVKTQKKTLVLFYLLALLQLTSCSMIIAKPEGESNKSYNIQFKSHGWEEINPDSSDFAFANKSSKSTILAQSYCKKYQASSLEVLSNNILNGINNLQTLEKKEVFTFGRQGIQSVASGFIDGVKVYLEMVNIQKDSCLYDFILISTSLENLKKDHNDFETFLKGLRE